MLIKIIFLFINYFQIQGRQNHVEAWKMQQKATAARILCTLLLGTYLTGGYGEKVAWGAPGTIADDLNIKGSGTVYFYGESISAGDVNPKATAWGNNAKAYG